MFKIALTVGENEVQQDLTLFLEHTNIYYIFGSLVLNTKVTNIGYL